MRRVLFSSLLILFFAPALIFAQRDSIRSIFLNAESWFLFEEYADALPLYESLYKSDPGNDKLKYKIGICLLNDPYQKDKAIQYLLEASHNINPAFKENSIKERTAPPDVLYYLGNAYLINELLERAIESYEEFLELMDHDVYDEELVLAQIRSCRTAQRLKTMPIDFDLTLIDSLINTRYADIRPVVSGDGTKMAFVTKLPFFDGAFYTEKRADGWSYPQIITQSMGFDKNVYPVALSYDGTEMILYYDDDYIGNLMAQELIEAANRGVKISISKDKLGCLFELSEESRQSFFNKKFDIYLFYQAKMLNLLYPMKRKAKSQKQQSNKLVKQLLDHQNIKTSYSVKKRDHSKYYIFDDQILIMGGINIEDKEILHHRRSQKFVLFQLSFFFLFHKHLNLFFARLMRRP